MKSDPADPTMEPKKAGLDALKELLSGLESVVVAYSGGVDSTLLLAVAHDTLGERAQAVMALSPTHPRREREAALAVARQIGARIAFVESGEMDDLRFVENSPERCYFCKSHIYDRLLDYARTAGFRWVVDGSNADDVADYRPGQRAARERGVRSPLQEVGLTKAGIRALARALGLPNWNRPADACLASRVPYGTPLTPETLARVGRAEEELRRRGFWPARVRHYGSLARVEVKPEDFLLLLARRKEIIAALRESGYTYVTLDLAGLRSGSLNEVLDGR